MITIESDTVYGGWLVRCSTHGLLANALRDDGAAEARAHHHRDRFGCQLQDTASPVSTEAERSVAAGLHGALALLRARDYTSLEVTLANLALDARSLALLGPEGVDGIPVSHVDMTVGSRPVDSIQEIAIGSRSYFVLTANGLDKLGRPDLAQRQRGEAAKALGYDSPAGAGHEVEADRG